MSPLNDDLFQYLVPNLYFDEDIISYLNNNVHATRCESLHIQMHRMQVMKISVPYNPQPQSRA